MLHSDFYLRVSNVDTSSLVLGMLLGKYLLHYSFLLNNFVFYESVIHILQLKILSNYL